MSRSVISDGTYGLGILLMHDPNDNETILETQISKPMGNLLLSYETLLIIIEELIISSTRSIHKSV